MGFFSDVGHGLTHAADSIEHGVISAYDWSKKELEIVEDDLKQTGKAVYTKVLEPVGKDVGRVIHAVGDTAEGVGKLAENVGGTNPMLLMGMALAALYLITSK